jgi:hypothetical protein
MISLSLQERNHLGPARPISPCSVNEYDVCDAAIGIVW